MFEIKPNRKNIGAEITVNLKEITNKDIFKIKKHLINMGCYILKNKN